MQIDIHVQRRIAAASPFMVSVYRPLETPENDTLTVSLFPIYPVVQELYPVGTVVVSFPLKGLRITG